MMTTANNNTNHQFSYNGLRAAYKFARLLDTPTDRNMTEFFQIAEKKWQQDPALLKGLDEVDRLLTKNFPMGDYSYGARLILASTVNRTITSARAFVSQFDKAARAITAPALPPEEKEITIMQTALVTADAGVREKLGRILPPAQALTVLSPDQQGVLKRTALRQTRKIAGTQVLEY